MEDNVNKIYKCKQYLTDTDYIIIKLYEKTLLGETIDEVLEEYKDILLNRVETRNLINELEEMSDVDNGN